MREKYYPHFTDGEMRHRRSETVLEMTLLCSTLTYKKALSHLFMLVGSAARSQIGFPGVPQNLGQVLIGDQAVSEMCNVSPGLYPAPL